MTHDLDPLLALDGASFEAAEGFVVEFKARAIEASPRRPHGLVYSLVLRPRAGGRPLVRFDNAHAVDRNRTTGIERSTTRVGLTDSIWRRNSWTISGKP